MSTISAHTMAATRTSAAHRPAAPLLAWQRTILVIDDQAEMSVALRDRLDRALVTVVHARPDEAPAIASSCRPWPWMVVASAALPAPVSELVESCPVLLVRTDREAPSAGGRSAGSFADLARSIETLLAAEVGGVRLAAGSGLTMPDGRHVNSPALEGLVAGHPVPLPMTARAARSASAALATSGLSLRAVRGPGPQARFVLKAS